MEKYGILVNDHNLGMVDTFKYFLDRSQWQLLTLSEKKFIVLPETILLTLFDNAQSCS